MGWGGAHCLLPPYILHKGTVELISSKPYFKAQRCITVHLSPKSNEKERLYPRVLSLKENFLRPSLACYKNYSCAIIIVYFRFGSKNRVGFSPWGAGIQITTNQQGKYKY